MELLEIGIFPIINGFVERKTLVKMRLFFFFDGNLIRDSEILICF